MKELDWLCGKTIASTQVCRAGQHLEMVLGLVGEGSEFVIELRNPDNLDWFDTDNMTVEEMVGRTVLRTETIIEEMPAMEGEGNDYTYVLYFADLSSIKIFADSRIVCPFGKQTQIRDQLYFHIRNPQEEPWDADDTSILDELDADLEATRHRHAAAEEGQLLPQELVKYVTHF